MDSEYKPTYHQIDEIYLGHIIFEKKSDSTDVTIFGYYKNPALEDLVRVDYWCEFSTLTDLLVTAKEIGEPLINAITEKLNNKEPDYPTIIDVEEIFDGPLKIEGIILTIYRPFEKNENGEWVEEKEEAFYILESVETKEAFEQRTANIDNLKIQFEECLKLLENMYQYYLQLLKMDTIEKAARRKAGLKDDLIFKMAFLNHQIKTKDK